MKQMSSLSVIGKSLHTVIDSPVFLTFIGFIVFDIFTGIAVAFKNHVINSKINKSGITKNFIVLTFVMFFSSLFFSYKMNELGDMIIYFYIGSYGLSIFENLTMLGVPFPEWLQEKFLVLKDENNKGDNHVIKRIEK